MNTLFRISAYKPLVQSLIQETYPKKEDVHRFQNKKCRLVVSCPPKKSKDVLILAKRSFHLSANKTAGHDHGGFTYAAVTANLLLTYVYMTNEPDQDFLNFLISKKTANIH